MRRIRSFLSCRRLKASGGLQGIASVRCCRRERLKLDALNIKFRVFIHKIEQMPNFHRTSSLVWIFVTLKVCCRAPLQIYRTPSRIFVAILAALRLISGAGLNIISKTLTKKTSDDGARMVQFSFSHTPPRALQCPYTPSPKHILMQSGHRYQ